MSNKFIFVLCTWFEISRSASKDLLTKTEILFKKKICLYLLLKEQLWPSCMLCVAAEYCSNSTDCTEAVEKSVCELLRLFSSKDGSLRVEAVIFCTAKTILRLKALALVFHCSSFCLDPSMIFCSNTDKFLYLSRCKCSALKNMHLF